MKAVYFIAVAAVLALAGCSDDEAMDASQSAGAYGSSGTGQLSPNSIEYFNQVVGDRVFFGTDRHDLDVGAQDTLRRQAEWLMANPGTNATIEGHADERGTRDYNLALGARRANAAMSFLISQGVPANRLNTISYGKERPAALCSDESCWSQNRRAVTVVVGAPVS